MLTVILMGFPSSSNCGAMSKTWRTHAMLRKIEMSAKYRPGQILPRKVNSCYDGGRGHCHRPSTSPEDDVGRIKHVGVELSITYKAFRAEYIRFVPHSWVMHASPGMKIQRQRRPRQRQERLHIPNVHHEHSTTGDEVPTELVVFDGLVRNAKWCDIVPPETFPHESVHIHQRVSIFDIWKSGGSNDSV